MKKNVLYIILFILQVGMAKSAKAGGENEIIQLKASFDTIPLSSNFELDIIMGTEENPIDSISEFTMSIFIDSRYFRFADTSKFSFTDTSFLGGGYNGGSSINGSNIGIFYNSQTGNRKGFGTIGTIKLVTEDDVPVVNNHVPLKITNILGKTTSNEIVFFDTENDTVYVIKLATSPHFQLNKYFKIFPNPTNNQITLSNRLNITIHTIEIIGIDGKTYQRSEIEEQYTTIGLKDLANGIYLIKLETDQGVFIDKVIKSD
jgi:hypothetical protein